MTTRKRKNQQSPQPNQQLMAFTPPATPQPIQPFIACAPAATPTQQQFKENALQQQQQLFATTQHNLSFTPKQQQSQQSVLAAPQQQQQLATSSSIQHLQLVAHQQAASSQDAVNLQEYQSNVIQTEHIQELLQFYAFISFHFK
jgi:hypothetical protein